MAPRGHEAVSAPLPAAVSVTSSARATGGSLSAAAPSPPLRASTNSTRLIYATDPELSPPPLPRETAPPGNGPAAGTSPPVGTTVATVTSAVWESHNTCSADTGTSDEQQYSQKPIPAPQDSPPQHVSHEVVPRRQPQAVHSLKASAVVSMPSSLRFPPTSLPIPLPAATGAVDVGQLQGRYSCPLRTWLRRTFPPIVLVGGTAAAKREVAALTGLTLAALFQPFNGEALAARLAASAAAAAEDQKRQPRPPLHKQQEKPHLFRRRPPHQQPKEGPRQPNVPAEDMEEEFLSREGYHPSHIYRYKLLDPSTNNSKTGAALSFPASSLSNIHNGPSSLGFPEYMLQIPPLNLLLNVPPSSHTKGSATAVPSGTPVQAPGSASSSLGSGSNRSAAPSSSLSSMDDSDAGEGASTTLFGVAPSSAERSYSPFSSSIGLVGSSASSHHNYRSNTSSNSDHFCVRFMDLEDAELPSSLAADALAVRALTQAPPALHDLSTFAAAAASSSKASSASATAQSHPGIVPPPPPPVAAATHSISRSATTAAPSFAPATVSRGAAAAAAPHDVSAASEVRRSGVRSSAFSPFAYPTEGSSVASETTFNCQPFASTTGCRGPDLLWYEEWERVLFESLRFSEHETLSQPVGLVLVASSRDRDPAQQLQQLLQPQRLPSLCNRFVLDPNPVRACVLLDIHPNALQARAELTAANLLRRRRPSLQQLPRRQQQAPEQLTEQQKQLQQPNAAPQQSRNFSSLDMNDGGQMCSVEVGGAATSAVCKGQEQGNSNPLQRDRQLVFCKQPSSRSPSYSATFRDYTADHSQPVRRVTEASSVGGGRPSESALPQPYTSSDCESLTTSTHRDCCGQSANGEAASADVRWQQQQGPRRSESAQSTDEWAEGKQSEAVGSCRRERRRGELLLEQLCAAFPPANCHLLTFGSATRSAAHWELLPAIRFLYAQSLTSNFCGALSAARTPVMLSAAQSPVCPQNSLDTLPPPLLPLRSCVEAINTDSSPPRGGTSSSDEDAATGTAAADTERAAADVPRSAKEEAAAAAAAVAAVEKGVVSAADVEWLLCSGYQLPVASRLTFPAGCSGGGRSLLPAKLSVTGAHVDGRGLLTAERLGAAAAALSSLENSFCVGLSWADLHALSAFVQHLVHTGILPWVERKTQQLETAISSSRRGFRNQLRYLWRKPKPSTGTASAITSATGLGPSAAVAGPATPGGGKTSGSVVASAAEQATGAAEALLSVVGGALLGDAASSFYSSSGLLHLAGGSSKSHQQQQPVKTGSGGSAGNPFSETPAAAGEQNTLKPREVVGASAKTVAAGGGTAPATVTAASAAGQLTAYQLHTVEWQYRLQADLYFFMGNFEAALQSFRACSADFKQHKRWPQLAQHGTRAAAPAADCLSDQCTAEDSQQQQQLLLENRPARGGAYEMQALCLFLTGGSRREIHLCIEHAYNAFMKAAAGRLALKCVLLGLRISMEMVAAALPLPSPFNPLSPLLSLWQRVRRLPSAAVGSAATAESAAVEAALQLLAANVDLPALAIPAQTESPAFQPPSQQEEAAASTVSRNEASATLSSTSGQPAAFSMAGVPLSGGAARQDPVQQEQHQAAVTLKAQGLGIRSAMLLEQAALCYEQAGLAHRRKRNFQLVMAGHTYYKAGYKRLALRCYTAVVSQYEWCGWQHVAQHLRFIMARQAFSLHLLLDAVFHFTALLNAVACVHHTRRLVCGRLSPTNQKRAALRGDNSSSASTVFSSSSRFPSSSSTALLSFLSRVTAAAAGPSYHQATEVALPRSAAPGAAANDFKDARRAVADTDITAAALGLPEISADREAHYVREFVFVCRVILERQKQQLAQQRQLAQQQEQHHTARIVGRSAAAESHEDRQPQGILSRSSNAFSSAGEFNAASAPPHCDTTAVEQTAAARTAQTTAAALAGDAASSSQRAAAAAGGGTARRSNVGGEKRRSPALLATSTLTLPVGLRVPYVECCNEQGIFRDAIEVRLQGDACVVTEEHVTGSSTSAASMLAPAKWHMHCAATLEKDEVWDAEALLQLLDASNVANGATSSFPVAGVCELAQCLLQQQQQPRQQIASAPRSPRLPSADQQELQLQESFLDDAWEAWVDTQLEAAEKRLWDSAGGAGSTVEGECDGQSRKWSVSRGMQQTLETGEVSARRKRTPSEPDAHRRREFFSPAEPQDEDSWRLTQLRFAKLSAAGAPPGDSRRKESSSSRRRSCTALYERIIRRMPVGSPVHVSISLTNPLQLPLDFRNVRLIGTIQAEVPAGKTPAAAAASVAGETSAPQAVPPLQHRQQRRTKKTVEFPAIPAVVLAPLETVCLRLVAVPVVPGKLRIKGVSLDLFGLIRLTQPFCLHGSLRQERQYNLRHCRLFSEESTGSVSPKAADGRYKESGSGSAANGARRCDATEEFQVQQFPDSASQGTLFPGNGNGSKISPTTESPSCLLWEAEDRVPEGSMPMSYVASAERYKLVPTGLPIEALRWRFRQRALEIHKEDFRLQILVDAALPLLSVSFLGWPDARNVAKQLSRLRSPTSSSPRRCAFAADAPPLVTATEANNKVLKPACTGLPAAFSAQCGSSGLAEKRKLPTFESIPPMLQGKQQLYLDEAVSYTARFSPSSAASPAIVDAGTTSRHSADPTVRREPSRPPEREHLFVGEHSTCVLQLSLPAHSPPLQALSLAVSPATLVRFQSALLMEPEDSVLQQGKAVRRSICAEQSSHVKNIGDEYPRNFLPKPEAMSAASALPPGGRLCAGLATGGQRSKVGGRRSLQLVLQEETFANSTKVDEQQTPLDHLTVAGPGSDAVATVHTSIKKTPDLKFRVGQSAAEKPLGAAGDGTLPEVDGACVQVVHVLRPPITPASSAAAERALSSELSTSESSEKEERSGVLMTGGWTVHLQLAVHALRPGIHRVRFCLKATAASAAAVTIEDGTGATKTAQPLLQRKDGLPKKQRLPTLWRGMEKILLVRSSLQLTVSPRLSWKHPNRHLLLCRVKNLSSETFYIERLIALLPYSTSAARVFESEGAATAATAGCSFCGRCGSPATGEAIDLQRRRCLPQSRSAWLERHSQRAPAGWRAQQQQGAPSCKVKIVPLLPCNKRQLKAEIGPHQTIHLLCAAAKREEQREGTADYECRCQQAQGDADPRQAAGGVLEGSSAARRPVIAGEIGEEKSQQASLEAGDLLESAVCAGTTVQVGLGWRLAVAPTRAAEGEGDRLNQPSKQEQQEEPSGNQLCQTRLAALYTPPVSAFDCAGWYHVDDLFHRPVPRGLILATSPVELSLRLSNIPLQMQIIICSPTALQLQQQQQQTLTSTAVGSGRSAALPTVSPTYALKNDSVRRTARSFSCRQGSCNVRQIRFLLHNTSATLLLRLQLLADLQAAAYALPLRLSADAAGSTAVMNSWKFQQSCSTTTSICTSRSSHSSNVGAPLASTAAGAGVKREAWLTAPLEDGAAANKLTAPSSGSDGASTISTVDPSGGTTTNVSSGPSPGRFAAALMQRLPLATNAAAAVSGSSRGGSGAAPGGLATYTGRASAGNAVGLGAPLLHFFVSPQPAPQVNTVAPETLHQPPKTDTTCVIAAPMSSEMLQKPRAMLPTSQLSVELNSASQATWCSLDGTAARTLILQQVRRQPQCCALPVVGSPVAFISGAASSTRVPPERTGDNPLKSWFSLTSANAVGTRALSLSNPTLIKHSRPEMQLPRGCAAASDNASAGLLSLKTTAASLDPDPEPLSWERLPFLGIEALGVEKRAPDKPFFPCGSTSSNVTYEDSLHLRTCGGFYWIGKPEQQLGCVGPGQKVEASLSAFFPSPGVFNVNKVYVRVQVAGQVLPDSSSSSGNISGSGQSTTGPSAVMERKEKFVLQPRAELEELCKNGCANVIFSPPLSAAPSARDDMDSKQAPWNVSKVSKNDSVGSRRQKRFLSRETLFCSGRMRSELEWETKLAQEGCEAVVGFPMECPVYIEPGVSGGSASECV